jgi:chromosome segregation ATPase
MLGISDGAWGAIGAFLGLLGTVGGVLAAWVAAANRRAHAAEMAASKATHDAEVLDLTSKIERLREADESVQGNLRTAWAKIDDLRETAVRKADWKEYRDEVRSDINLLGERFEKAIAQLRDELRHKKEAA